MMKVGILQKAGLALVLAMVAGVSNASIVRVYDDPFGFGSGIVTYTQLGLNQLQIDFDNTTDGSLYSSVITGLVFNIDQDVNTVTLDSFVAGDNTDLSGAYNVALNVNNNITPGNTQVDLAITTTNGINSGIYNFANPGNNISNVVPDIATLILTINNPTPWALNAISDDILRMQRTGGEEGSLKIPGVPVPAASLVVWFRSVRSGWNRS